MSTRRRKATRRQLEIQKATKTGRQARRRLNVRRGATRCGISTCRESSVIRQVVYNSRHAYQAPYVTTAISIYCHGRGYAFTQGVYGCHQNTEAYFESQSEARIHDIWYPSPDSSLGQGTHVPTSRPTSSPGANRHLAEWQKRGSL